MHGRICFAAATALLALASCSSNPLMKPDCHSCTVEEQGWKEFSWAALAGRWKGSVENLRNERGAVKKAKTEKAAELVFLKADQFLGARGATCPTIPARSIVLNGLLWEPVVPGTKEYEVFSPAEKDRVAYGRLTFEADGSCKYRRLGRVMGKNRLNLPTVSFSEKTVSMTASTTGKKNGRAPASNPAAVPGEQEVSVEFLRFAAKEPGIRAFTADGRKPSAVKEQERPALILRVFKVGTTSGAPKGAIVGSVMGKAAGEWSGTDEAIYRMWRVE